MFTDDCKICGAESKMGIVLLNTHICIDCEKTIVKTKVEDTLKYEFYKNFIKNIWKNHTIVFGE